MGATQSVVSAPDPKSTWVGEGHRTDYFGLWPGLETQIEASFHSIDVNDDGILPYETLEPVARHHLMQIGLLEFVTRFATPSGQLNANEIAPYLREYGINLEDELTLVQWKNLMICWIRRVQDAKHEDIQNWQNSLKALQEQQARDFQMALEKFQTHYVNQVEAYYRAVEAANKDEERYRKEWEESLELQEEYYNTQMQSLHERNAAAQKEYEEQVAKQEAMRFAFLNNLRQGATIEPNGIVKRTFAYPSQMTPTGAPISGGSFLPRRRVRQRAA